MHKDWPFSDLSTHGSLRTPKGKTETHKGAETTLGLCLEELSSQAAHWPPHNFTSKFYP